jgi:hypothetical protein
MVLADFVPVASCYVIESKRRFGSADLFDVLPDTLAL